MDTSGLSLTCSVTFSWQSTQEMEELALWLEQCNSPFPVNLL